jgi:hypothetical protein
MEVQVTEETISEIVRNDLISSYEYAWDDDIRKHLIEVIKYYSTTEQFAEFERSIQ